MSRLLLWFVKITGFPVQYFYFKKRVYYESNLSPRKIKGAALIVSNHTSIFDYALIMYTFFTRSIRTLVAKEIFEKNWFMNIFMKGLGAIKVERQSYDFSFMPKMIKCLNKKQVGLVFPEARLPRENEREDFLPFKPSYIYLALETGVPIIPVYTNGIYGKLKKKRNSHAKIIIGDPIYPRELISEEKTEKENLEWINNYVRDYIKRLKNIVESGN